MTMYNTGNALGSTDPKDLSDNAQVFDKLATGTAPRVTDRLGRERLSWGGMEYEFNTAQDGRESAFQDFLANSGFVFIGDYGTGLTFTNRSQYTIRDGYAYRLATTTTVPYTATGNWALEVGNFSLIDADDILRQDLQAGLPNLVKSSAIFTEPGKTLDARLSAIQVCLEASELQAMVNTYSTVWVPPYVEFEVVNLEIPSNRTLILDGTLRLSAASPDGSVIIKNSDQVGGNTGIRVIGKGLLDGNKAAQVGADTKHTLAHFKNCTFSEFAVAEARGNYFPRALGSEFTTGMILFEDCENCSMHDSRGDDYGRECFWMKNCDRSEMYNLRAYGGADSWSGFQFSGDYNKAYNWYSYYAGASGGSFDCRYSSIDGWTVENNRFTSCINFGHQGLPASGSVASNLQAIGGSKEGASNVCNSINVGGATDGLVLNNIHGIGAPDNGLNISDNSNNITVNGFEFLNGGVHGIKIFGTSAQTVRLSNGRVSGFVSNGLRLDGGVLVECMNSDLRGNTGPALARDASSREVFTSVRLSNDDFSGSVAIAGLGVGGTTTITNGNITARGQLLIEPSNAAGEAARPYVVSKTLGSAVIATPASGAGGASARYYIR